jgi:hypothetical protein
LQEARKKREIATIGKRRFMGSEFEWQNTNEYRTRNVD